MSFLSWVGSAVSSVAHKVNLDRLVERSDSGDDDVAAALKQLNFTYVTDRLIGTAPRLSRCKGAPFSVEKRRSGVYAAGQPALVCCSDGVSVVVRLAVSHPQPQRRCDCRDDPAPEAPGELHDLEPQRRDV
jgi:hypothetical protein